MLRSRSLLLLLVLVAVLVAVGPRVVAEEAAAAPLAPASEVCEAPAWSPELGTLPAMQELAVPPDPDFILCSCKLCRSYPDEVCQISPTGFSILCADYYAWRCV